MTKRGTDWEALGKEWRTGQHSNYALGEKYGVSESAIRKKKIKLGWEKDLTQEYEKEFKNQLIKERTQPKDAPRTIKTDEDLQDDKQTVKAAVDVAINVVRRHRKRIGELDDLYKKLYDKVIVAIEEKPNDDKTLPSLVGFKSYHESLFDIVSKLASVNSNLTKLERQAFNMDTKTDTENLKDKSTDELLKILNACRTAKRN